MTVYTALPADDLNLAVEVTESNDMVTINITPAIVNTGGGGVTSVDTGSGLTGGPITSTGTIAIDATVATLTGAQALSNKTGLISQWTNDSAYITSASLPDLTNLTGVVSIAPDSSGMTITDAGQTTVEWGSSAKLKWRSQNDGGAIDQWVFDSTGNDIFTGMQWRTSSSRKIFRFDAINAGGTDPGDGSHETSFVLSGVNNTFKSRQHNESNTGLKFDAATIDLVTDSGVSINSNYTFPQTDGTANQVLQTDGAGNITFATNSGAGTTINNNADNRIITGSNTANTLEGEANFTWDGTNGLISGTASDLTTPVLKLETSNSNWNAPQLLCADSNGNVFSQVGRHNTTDDLYQWNITLDPDNTNGRTGVTTFAGDYFVSFEKNYSDQSDIRMDMNVYGAHNAFNINVRDDYNSGGGNQYGLRPLNLNALETNINAGTNGDLVFTADGTGITFGDGSYTFPLSDGTANQVLQTDGAGNISFATASGGGATDLNGLSDVDIVSVSDGDILRYNGTATKWQNTNLGLTLTPIVTLNSNFYASAEATATITNWSSYTDPNVFAQVEDSLGNIIITNAQISAGIDLTLGTVTFNVGTTIATGFKLKVRVQDFGDLASDTAENTFLVEAVSVNSTFRYYRLTDFSGFADTGGLPTQGNRVMVGTFRLWSATGGTGTQYPPDMTTNTAPTPNVALASRLFQGTYDYYKAFDSNQNNSFWWNLGDTPTQALSAWIQIDLGASYNVRSIQIAQGQVGYGFTGGKIYGSDTGVFGGEEALVLDATGLLNPWTSTSNFILG
tara:strand:- start:1860 stop:4229 length:2370 start_codon:yes stop_codon:yes gene_type:complete